MTRIFAALALLLAALAAPASAEDAVSPEAKRFLESLTPRNGSIALPQAKATLELGDDYIFYGPEDAAAILVQAWGNPPEAAEGVLGLVMPAGSSPLSDSWGAVVTYEDTGYVSDDDAAEADYDQILADLQEASEANNEDRRAAGYPGLEVVGWAERPKYDKASHAVVWARDIKFDDGEVHTLNYDIRSLGRQGVLSLNLISSLPELANIRIAARDFSVHAHFDPGARYEDFKAATDREAEYGVAGLVAAGVGVATAKKLGILALLLKFLKPIALAVVVGFGVFWKRLKRLFGLRDDEEADWQNYEEEALAVQDEPAAEVEPADAEAPAAGPVDPVPPDR